VYHVFNRAVGKMALFRKQADYEAFERVMIEAQAIQPMRILGWCIMRNHWHMVLWPRGNKDLSKFMFWLTMTHAQRWRHARKLVGLGPLYQGRFKAFPMESDRHMGAVLRYVERNALRAGLSTRAEGWRWGSLHVRQNAGLKAAEMLSAPPIALKTDWVNWVNEPQSKKEEDAIRECIIRNRPWGSAGWRAETVERLGLESSMRPRGRPRKAKDEEK